MPAGPQSSDPDAALVAQARDGDRAALTELYRRYSSRGYNLALRMLGDPWDAADVSQEAFIKAFGALKGFKGEARFSTWFHRIVVNAVYDHLRRRRLDPMDEEVLTRLSAPGGSGRLAGGIQWSVDPHTDGFSPTLREALLSLGEGFRAAVVLCDVLGFDYGEAAEILGVQEGTIKSRIFRARAQLASYLTEHGYDEPHRQETTSAAEPDPSPQRHTTDTD